MSMTKRSLITLIKRYQNKQKSYSSVQQGLKGNIPLEALLRLLGNMTVTEKVLPLRVKGYTDLQSININSVHPLARKQLALIHECMHILYPKLEHWLIDATAYYTYKTISEKIYEIK